jgi:hypothetical protein
MTVPLSLLRQLQASPPDRAWASIMNFAWEVFSQPLEPNTAPHEINSRDSQLAGIDLFLMTAGWDLWREFDASIEHTADALIRWWAETPDGKAVLILDALSLREAPWIFHGAAERGYQVKGRVTGAELPADTTQFAKVLGFSQRSTLANNMAGGAHKLAGARTDCVDYPWAECHNLAGAEPRIVLWHQWPDSRVHDYAAPGQGVTALTKETVERLNDDAFWTLIERLTTGRRLVITSDHGYAATGSFADTPDTEQKEYLKDIYGSSRWTKEDGVEPNPWLPPLDLILETRQGRNRFVLGRRKWRSQGGYPTLAHGGLSVLEVASPFIEISR